MLWNTCLDFELHYITMCIVECRSVVIKAGIKGGGGGEASNYIPKKIRDVFTCPSLDTSSDEGGVL